MRDARVTHDTHHNRRDGTVWSPPGWRSPSRRRDTPGWVARRPPRRSRRRRGRRVCPSIWVDRRRGRVRPASPLLDPGSDWRSAGVGTEHGDGRNRHPSVGVGRTRLSSKRGCKSPAAGRTRHRGVASALRTDRKLVRWAKDRMPPVPREWRNAMRTLPPVLVVVVVAWAGLRIVEAGSRLAEVVETGSLNSATAWEKLVADALTIRATPVQARYGDPDLVCAVLIGRGGRRCLGARSPTRGRDDTGSSSPSDRPGTEIRPRCHELLDRCRRRRCTRRRGLRTQQSARAARASQSSSRRRPSSPTR